MSAEPIVVERRERAEAELAREIAELVRAKPRAVLGLAAGDTPLGVYRELARMRREEGLDLSRIATFSLDEYFEIPADHPATFRRWMHERFLDAAGIADASARIPASSLPASDVAAHCEAYEREIRGAGGVDLWILGIGRNGHVGFNEPGSERASRTRLVDLHAATREDATAAFGGLDRVPRRAITVGIATILEARRVRVLAFGARKAAIVARALEGLVGSDVPATFLRGHPDARIWLDREAAADLASAHRSIGA